MQPAAAAVRALVARLYMQMHAEAAQLARDLRHALRSTRHRLRTWTDATRHRRRQRRPPPGQPDAGAPPAIVIDGVPDAETVSAYLPAPSTATSIMMQVHTGSGLDPAAMKNLPPPPPPLWTLPPPPPPLPVPAYHPLPAVPWHRAAWRSPSSSSSSNSSSSESTASDEDEDETAELTKRRPLHPPKPPMVRGAAAVFPARCPRPVGAAAAAAAAAAVLPAVAGRRTSGDSDKDDDDDWAAVEHADADSTTTIALAPWDGDDDDDDASEALL
jgi:hypothetical protein